MAQYNSKNKSQTVARRWYSDIDMNMTLHPESKDVSLKYDINAIKRSLKNILSTGKYERPFKPNFGVDITNMLFQLDDGKDEIVLNQQIELAVQQFEPRVKIVDIISSSHGHALMVSIFFTVLNDPRPHEIDITLQKVR